MRRMSWDTLPGREGIADISLLAFVYGKAVGNGYGYIFIFFELSALEQFM